MGSASEKTALAATGSQGSESIFIFILGQAQRHASVSIASRPSSELDLQGSDFFARFFAMPFFNRYLLGELPKSGGCEHSPGR
jgi:hypothetical protein